MDEVERRVDVEVPEAPLDGLKEVGAEPPEANVENGDGVSDPGYDSVVNPLGLSNELEGEVNVVAPKLDVGIGDVKAVPGEDGVEDSVPPFEELGGGTGPVSDPKAVGEADDGETEPEAGRLPLGLPGLLSLGDAEVGVVELTESLGILTLILTDTEGTVATGTVMVGTEILGTVTLGMGMIGPPGFVIEPPGRDPEGESPGTEFD